MYLNTLINETQMLLDIIESKNSASYHGNIYNFHSIKTKNKKQAEMKMNN